MISRRNGIILNASVICMSFAFAVADGQDQKSDPRESERPVLIVKPESVYRAKQVLSSRMSINGNVAIGVVDDIVFGDDGYVEYLIVNNNNKLVTVPWEAAKFDFARKTGNVGITAERFREIPTYTVETHPVFSDPRYRTQTHQYYGTDPALRLRRTRAPIPALND